MRWTVDLAEGSEAFLTWEAGRLASDDPGLVSDVERFAATEDECAPMPGTLYLVGLVDPMQSWATITVALSEDRPAGAVKVPEPPVSLGAEGEDRIY